MAELTVSNLAKSYGIDEIFSGVSFNIEKNDKVGIIGANGAGKTTLFNIITGDLEADEGNIYKKNDLKLGYLMQNIHIESEKNLYDECLEEFDYIFAIEDRLKKLEEDLALSKDLELTKKITIEYNNLLEKYDELGGYYYPSKIESILKGMGFPKERHGDIVSNLSGGEKSRLQLAKLMLSNPDVLLLDEPTNHLDMGAIEFLESFLNDFEGAVLIISHDRYFLDKLVNRIFLLEHKGLYVYNANYTDFMKRRKKDLEVIQKSYENQQKEIKRQEEIIERFANLGGSKRKRGISQSRSRQKLLDKMKKMDRPQDLDNKMKLIFRPKVESGMDVLEVENLTMGFDDKLLFEDISLNIYKGEKVGLIGGNGTGKTTLFKLILNQLKPREGQVNLGVGVFPTYFDQEQSNLNYENTVLDEIWDEYPDLNHYDLRSYLAKFMFTGDDIFKMIGDLSGGERARVSLLKLMLSTSNFLLLDEPTNHLDIDSKEALEDALDVYEGTAFIISHDRYFLNTVVDKIFVLEDGKIELFQGNYDYYQEKINQRKVLRPEEEGMTKTQIKKDERKKRQGDRELRKIKSQARKLEKEVEELSLEIQALEEESFNPEIYEDHERALKLHSQIDKLGKIKEAKEEVWMEIIDQLDV